MSVAPSQKKTVAAPVALLQQVERKPVTSRHANLNRKLALVPAPRMPSARPSERRLLGGRREAGVPAEGEAEGEARLPNANVAAGIEVGVEGDIEAEVVAERYTKRQAEVVAERFQRR
ncbi:unnamed protein product [Polarella glacialis]|uniref:Uncharacterized protein n=1 Tax=Polarella glacialis TaxID=89957 RepID=A0A813LRA0_POLGL|nr:unnamed protein product [Polarella glacialis]